MAIRKVFLLLCVFCCCFVLTSCGGDDQAASVPTTTMGEISEYRPTFTVDSPPDYHVLNSITDNPTIGDEREFIRIYDDEGNEYIDEITLEPNKIYEARIYYHNNYTNSANCIDNARCSAVLPESVSRNSITLFHCKLTCTATFPAPESYEDSIRLHADQDVSLRYISGSANNHYYSSNGKESLPFLEANQLFEAEGAKIGCEGSLSRNSSGRVFANSQPSYISLSFFVSAGIATADSAASTDPTNTP